MTSVSSFVTSLVTSLIIFLGLFFAFVRLHSNPANDVIFFPAWILKRKKRPPREERNSLTWFFEVLRTREEETVAFAGLDAAVYILFLRTCLQFFFYSAIVCLCVLIPICVTDSFYSDYNASLSPDDPDYFKKKLNFGPLDLISMGNVKPKSNRLWACCVCAWIVSLIACRLFSSSYEHAAKMRALEKARRGEELREYAVLVRDIPLPRKEREGDTDEEQEKTGGEEGTVSLKFGLDRFFRGVFKEDYLGGTVLPELKEVKTKHHELVASATALLKAEAKFRKETFKNQKLIEGEGETTSPRPSHRTGFLGLLGEKVDSIEFFSKQIEEKERELGEKQRKLREKTVKLLPAPPAPFSPASLLLNPSASGGKVLSSVVSSTSQVAGGVGNVVKGEGGSSMGGIAFFRSRTMAAAASQVQMGEKADEWSVSEAPSPNDVVWENLALSRKERMIRTAVVYFITFLAICFYMIPISFVSSLTTLTNLRKTAPFLKPIIEQKALSAVLGAFLPQLALIIFLSLLPAFLTFLSAREGIPSRSHITRAAAGKYFLFNVFNVFLGVTLTGSLFASLQQVLNKPSSLVDLLASSLPQNASFFITFIALKFLVAAGLELSRVVPLLIFTIKRRFLCPTQKSLSAAWHPGEIDLLRSVPGDLLVFTLGACYAVIAPLILVFAVAYFAIGWAIAKNQILRVYVADVESHGRFFPHMHAKMIGALLTSQLTMFGYFGIKKFVGAVLLLPLPILTLLHFLLCHMRYYPSFQRPSMEVASRPIRKGCSPPSLEELSSAYVPDCMREGAKEEALGDEAESLEGAPVLLTQEEEERLKERMGERATEAREEC